MPHVFEFKNVKVLESEDRGMWLSTEHFTNIVRQILPEEERIAACEIGTGAGYFTIPLSYLFRKVYAVELSVDMLNYLRTKTQKLGINNIEFVLSKDVPQLSDKLSLILFSNVMHELIDRDKYMAWASANSRIVVNIDWKRIKTPRGPPVDDRIDQADAIELFRAYGFSVRQFNIYPFHYFLVGFRGS